jgi:hypothetical protein
MPIDSDPVADPLLVSLDAGELDLKFGAGGERLNMILSHWLWLRTRALLERDDFEGNAQDLRDFLAELSVLGEVVACSPQSAPDYLLAEKL